MSTTGRRRVAEEEEGAPEDATLENVAEATRELDHIVDGIIRKGHKVSKEKLKKKSRRGEKTQQHQPARDSERGKKDNEEKEEGESQVVRLRFSGSSTVEDGQVAYVYMKRKALLLPHMDEVRLVSDPQKHNEPLLKVQVSRCDDPEWTHMTILVMDRDKRLLAVVDLECRGEEARAVRINGIPVAPICGECIRMMFAIAGVPLEEERVQFQDWEAMAKSKATPFDALPMLEVDGVKFAQTLAILRYIARETGFAGPDNLTAAKADALADQYADFVMAFVPWHIVNAGYAPGDKDALYDSTYVPARAKNFPYFEAALQKSSTGWYADTPELTHVDVFIAASLEWVKRMDKNADQFFDGFPLMEAQYKKFFAHPKLQKYLEERPDAPY